MRQPTRTKRSDTRFPYTTLFRAGPGNAANQGRSGGRGITRPARSEAREGRGNPPDRQARPHSGRDGPALAAGGRNRPRSRTAGAAARSEEHTSELQSLMRISYAALCLKKKNKNTRPTIKYR